MFSRRDFPRRGIVLQRHQSRKTHTCRLKPNRLPEEDKKKTLFKKKKFYFSVRGSVVYLGFCLTSARLMNSSVAAFSLFSSPLHAFRAEACRARP